MPSRRLSSAATSSSRPLSIHKLSEHSCLPMAAHGPTRWRRSSGTSQPPAPRRARPLTDRIGAGSSCLRADFGNASLKQYGKYSTFLPYELCPKISKTSVCARAPTDAASTPPIRTMQANRPCLTSPTRPVAPRSFQSTYSGGIRRSRGTQGD